MGTEYSNQIAEKAFLFLSEFLKNQSDYFKHLTTLSTGSILIVIALIKEVFKNPRGLILIGPSFFFFLVSLIGALYMIQVLNGFNEALFTLFSDMLGMMVGRTENDVSGMQAQWKKKTDPIVKAAKLFHPITDISFLIGIVAFLVFACMNFL